MARPREFGYLAELGKEDRVANSEQFAGTAPLANRRRGRTLSRFVNRVLMPPAPESPNLLSDAVKRIASADRAGQTRGLIQLGRWANRPSSAINTFNALLGSGKEGRRLALEFVVRIPGNLPHSLILVAAPLLSDSTVPVAAKLAAAARFVEVLPDRRETIGPVLRAVTAGLKKGRALARLIALQHRVERCESLDAAIAVMELNVRLKCPVCTKSFSRPALIKHLWKKHRTGYDRGKIISPAAAAEQLIAEGTGDDPSSLDRAFLQTADLFPKSTRRHVLQGLASRHWRSSDQYAPLADEAGEQHAGLCPKCYAAVPEPIPELPPPLVLSHGRLAGEGFHLSVFERWGRRRIRVDRPTGEREERIDDRGVRSPRSAGVLYALPFAVTALVAAAIMPPFKPGPLGVALWLGIITVLVYLTVWAFRRDLVSADQRVVDVAWSDLVPGIGRSPAAAQILTRLCRTSLTVGDPGERSKLVWELADHASVLADKGGIYVSLYAASVVLRAADAGKIGRDVVGELAALLANVFRGELSAPIAELMAILIHDDVALTHTERNRLALVLAASAFDYGLTPADIPLLRRHLPQFVRLLPDEMDQLQLLYAVWQGKPGRPWDRAAECEPIFVLAKTRPALAIRALKADPDAVLVHTPDDYLADRLGLVTVNRRGVSFGGATVADPRAEVTVVSTKEGGELTFGRSVFTMPRRPPESIERALKKLLVYRAETLIPQAESLAGDPSQGRASTILTPLAVPCLLCRTVSLIRSGQLGVPPG